MKTRLRTFQASVRQAFLCLLVMVLLISQLSFTAAPAPTTALVNGPIEITPDQMTFTGDVATQANTLGQCTESWLSGVPAGSIILGVNPTSCDPKDWGGASASITISLPNIYTSTLYVLKLSWPDQDGKGLHSPLRNQSASINFDTELVWNKRTLDVGANGDYYGAQHEQILTTLIVTQSASHTISFAVPAHTAWDISQIVLTAYAAPTKIHGIGYSPYLDCQYPGGAILPSTRDVQVDLSRLFHTSNAIRTYSSTGINAQVPALANQLGIPVFSGAWLDKNAQDDTEIQGLISLANSAHLDGVIVGNEYYLRHRTPADIDSLHQRILQVKNNIPAGIPITSAEIDTLMFNWVNNVPSINPAYRSILDAEDIILVHIYPFWSGLPIEGAAAYTVDRYTAIQALIAREYPGRNKRVIIGEAGWPSAGGPQGLAVPNQQNQRRYLLEFMTLAEQQGVEYFYFDGFDELWKIEESGHVGQHWGYSYTDRSAKHPFYGVLLPATQLASYPTAQPALPISDPSIPGATPLQIPAQDAKLAKEPVTSTPASFNVYDEWPEGPGHFVPSMWMGDIANIQFYGCDRSDPYEGEMAIRASFSPGGTLGWSGVYWQYPEKNYGNLPDGIKLTGMNKLTFWAKGALGGEKIRFMAGGIGSQTDPYPDSLRPDVTTGFIALTTSWQQYSINLVGKDLSHVIGGFGWATDSCASPQGATFFLDKIQYEYDPNLLPPSAPGPLFPIYTDAAAQDNHYFPSGWMGDAKIPGKLSLTECWQGNPHSGTTSIRIDYPQSDTWAAVYWLQPSENWGDRPGGADLTGADRLTFWARSDTPDARVKFLIGGVGYAPDYLGNTICGSPLYIYPDSVCPKIEQAQTLNPNWTKYTIDLHQHPRNLSHVVGGFGWLAESPLTFYLDDIVYEFDTETFADVSSTYWAWAWIETLAKNKVTIGCSSNPKRYCPSGTVTRDQMAVFLLRAKHGSDYVPPKASGVFADVPVTQWAADWIEQLALEGITTGCGANPKRYCPDNPVTRAEMAVFLLRSNHISAYTPPAASGVFTDVPTTYWDADWIEQLALEGITTGCSNSPKMYCPDSPVTRDQMAIFLVRAFGLK